ncbi:MAG: cupin domain-containing protein [Deltaproteobacteria bacterium]
MLRKVDEIPADKVSGHEGFLARSLYTSADKKTTLRILDIEPGGTGPVPPHSHSDIHLFVVLEGELEVDVGERTLTVPAGSYLEIEPDVSHQLRCTAKSPVKILALKYE